MNCLKPGIDCSEAKFGDDTKCPLSAFKAARLFSPAKVDEMKPAAAAEVDTLCAFPFLNDVATRTSLKSELPTYLSKVQDISKKMDVLEWWKLQYGRSQAAQKVFLIQPSSAAAECAFSLLNNSFNEQQYNSLEDYVESSIMLQYNN